MDGNEIYTITLYYNGLIENTRIDLPYMITTEIDKAIEIANGKLENPNVYVGLDITEVAITTWGGTETRTYTHRTVKVVDYTESNVTFDKNEYGVYVNIPS